MLIQDPFLKKYPQMKKILKYEQQPKHAQHMPCIYSLFTHCPFDSNKYKHRYYRGANCMKRFCADLRNHATKIKNCEEKEMIPLTKKDEI